MAKIKCPDCAWIGEEVDADWEEEPTGGGEYCQIISCPDCHAELDESDVLGDDDGT